MFFHLIKVWKEVLKKLFVDGNKTKTNAEKTWNRHLWLTDYNYYNKEKDVKKIMFKLK